MKIYELSDAELRRLAREALDTLGSAEENQPQSQMVQNNAALFAYLIEYLGDKYESRESMVVDIAITMFLLGFEAAQKAHERKEMSAWTN